MVKRKGDMLSTRFGKSQLIIYCSSDHGMSEHGLDAKEKFDIFSDVDFMRELHLERYSGYKGDQLFGLANLSYPQLFNRFVSSVFAWIVEYAIIKYPTGFSIDIENGFSSDQLKILDLLPNYVSVWEYKKGEQLTLF